MSKKRLIYAVLVLIFLLLLAAVENNGADGRAQTDRMENEPLNQNSAYTDSDLLLVEESENSSDDGSVSAAEARRNLGEDNSEIKSKKTAESQEKDEIERNYEEIVETIDQLLTYGTSDFYEHYPVDESFFLWL